MKMARISRARPLEQLPRCSGANLVAKHDTKHLSFCLFSLGRLFNNQDFPMVATIWMTAVYTCLEPHARTRRESLCPYPALAPRRRTSRRVQDSNEQRLLVLRRRHLGPFRAIQSGPNVSPPSATVSGYPGRRVQLATWLIGPRRGPVEYVQRIRRYSCQADLLAPCPLVSRYMHFMDVTRIAQNMADHRRPSLRFYVVVAFSECVRARRGSPTKGEPHR